MEIKVLHNQTLLDVSIYLFGTAKGAFQLAEVNNLSVTDDIIAGQILEIPNDLDFGERLTVEYYQLENLKPATAIQLETLEIIELPSGIDYWAIQIDFEIQ
ncbi:hypothetical protein [Empedobacter tilapiae]|uniref:LysM domain-containing protein n=1 Tax=Empedobacter tilapiae TaxID=2491114 RepID=A0A4Z1BWD7_9FLAO|nr:hypothetical protein [Empedobacter tilapiae]TGN26755.1 hypothetical protein E4J94_09930 [Empedobacter tilapiae]